MASKIETRTVSIGQAIGLVLAAFATRRNGRAAPKVPMLWGPPGIGKSEMIQGIADSGKLGNCLVIDVRLPLMEPTDIRGIPFFDPQEKTMKWAPSEEFPTKEQATAYDNIILFLDELSAAPPSVQAAAYQLILNRRVGPYVLPDNVLVVAAGNRDGDGSVSFRMPQALRNRMVHFEVKCEFDSWFNWAVDANINADVLAYLNHAKSDLFKFDPKSADRAYPTPRSWTFVSDIMETHDEVISDGDLMEMVSGTIGEGTANGFMAYRAMGRKLPTPTEILEGKVTDLKNNEVSAMYSLTFHVCQELRDIALDGRLKADQQENMSSEEKKKLPVKLKDFHEKVNNALVFMMKNFQKDMTVMGARTMLHTYKLPINPAELDCFQELHKNYGASVAKAMKQSK